MPMYLWRCQKCQTSAEVLRTFDEYLVAPTEEEVGAPRPQEISGQTPNSDEHTGASEPCDHAWDREIGKTSVIKGPSWGWGSKGNW